MKPGIRDLLWMATGGAAFLAGLLVVERSRDVPSPGEQFAAKARRLELVDQMRVALASASENEKLAVQATTDEDSRLFADQSRVASAAVEQARQVLAGLLPSSGEQHELLSEFSQAFDAVVRVDAELLDLAVRNSNLKAYALAYGPAADRLNAMEDALAGLVAETGGGADGTRVQVLALQVEVAARGLQVLLPPHIAEESDERMDQMEARMTEREQEVQRNLDGLQGLPRAAGHAGLAAAASAWAQFREAKGQILSLSRENTNVRSLAMSLDRKRKLMLACQSALDALRRAIDAEPIAGVTEGPPAKPR